MQTNNTEKNNRGCIHCYVLGKVQGVSYRKYTKKYADEHGIKGWVKNLPDGRVEIMACGDAIQLEVFISCLQEGSPSSEVSKIVRNFWQYQEYESFNIIK